MLSSKKLHGGSYPDVFLATLHYKSVIMEREHPGDRTQGGKKQICQTADFRLITRIRVGS